jgi:hypothetical protein
LKGKRKATTKEKSLSSSMTEKRLIQAERH